MAVWAAARLASSEAVAALAAERMPGEADADVLREWERALQPEPRIETAA
jgi:hypothetical protein